MHKQSSSYVSFYSHLQKLMKTETSLHGIGKWLWLEIRHISCICPKQCYILHCRAELVSYARKKYNSKSYKSCQKQPNKLVRLLRITVFHRICSYILPWSQKGKHCSHVTQGIYSIFLIWWLACVSFISLTLFLNQYNVIN